MSKPDLTAYRQTSTRTYMVWSVDLLRAAESTADSGSLRLAADLCDALHGDDRLPRLLGKRAGNLFGLVPTFEAAGDGRKKGRTVRALEADEDWWEMFPEDESAEVFRWGITLGVGLGELVPTEVVNGRTIARQRDGRFVPRLKTWHPRFLRFDQMSQTWLLRLDTGSEITITPGDGRWILYTPYGAQRPWVRGMWRGLSRWWLLKQYGVDDLGRYSEKAGSVAVTSPPQATKEQRRDLAASLFDMSKDAVIALPPGFDMKAVELTGDGALYQGIIEAANTAMAVAINGHNLTSEVNGGSFAASTTGEHIGENLTKQDAESWSTCTHDQALVWWAEWNFGAQSLAPWPCYPTDPPKDKKSDADTLVALGTAITELKAIEPRVDAVAMLEAYDVPLLSKGDPAAQPSPPPEPPPPPDGAAPPVDGETPPPDAPPPDAPVTDPTKATALAATNTSPGYIRGQVYADDLAEAARAAGAAVLSPDLKALLGTIGDAGDYETLRHKLRAAFADMNPDDLASVVERSMVLARLRGRLSVLEDL